MTPTEPDDKSVDNPMTRPVATSRNGIVRVVAASMAGTTVE